MSYQLDVTGEYMDQQFNDMMVTPEGGIAVKFTNNMGTSIKGTLLQASESIANAVEAQTEEFDVMGIMYSNGLGNGEEAWVVVNGIAEVLIADGTTSTLGYWVEASSADGRADATQPLPPGGTITALTNHFKEIGHCLETKGAGTDVLAKTALHFN